MGSEDTRLPPDTLPGYGSRMVRRWLLYGANGFTGRRIAAEAVARGLSPVLAGRSAGAVAAVAEETALEWRAFPLDDPAALDAGLEGVAAVLLAAGPFSATSASVVDACLRRGIHYLDITGEIPVFEAVFARDAEAKRRGALLLPGVGFDVVPTDCLAVRLARALPRADRLELAFASGGGPSAGTAKTMVEGLARGGAVREGGRIRREPHGARRRTIPFADRPRRGMSIPWGDVATAYRSTGIPNIVVYTPGPGWLPPLARVARPVLGVGPVRRLAQRAIERRVRGPAEEGRSRLWGRASQADGAAVEGTGETPGGYAFTALSAVECAERLLAVEWPPGAWTPASLFGPELLEAIPGCRLEVGAAEPAGGAGGTDGGDTRGSTSEQGGST